MRSATILHRWRLSAALALVAVAVMAGMAQSLLGLASTTSPVGSGLATARNVVLFVGDGASHPQYTAARLYYRGAGGTLNLDRLTNVAGMTTHSYDSLVTDSAASATAMATGVKTVNGAVSVGPGGNRLVTVMEQAKAAGYLVGLITTAQITDATPAAFASHVSHRSQETSIALQYLNLGVDVLLGGGESYFLPTSVTGKYPAPGKRTDGRNLISEAQAAGYTYVWDEGTLAAVNPATTRGLLGLFADEQMYVAGPESDSRVTVMRPYLTTMTQKAIDVLLQQSAGRAKGFFLVVEEEATDDFSHGNNAEQTIAATKRLDDAVGVAITLAIARGDTLVIALSDHNTGAMGILAGTPGVPCPANDGNGAPVDGVGGTRGRSFPTPDGKAFCVSWGTAGHSGSQVRIAAWGPASDLVGGKIDNTDVFGILRSALGLWVWISPGLAPF